MPSTLVLTVLLFLTTAAVTVRSIPFRELDSMFDSLRTRGYDLFCNAIVTSDLQIDLLSIDDANDTHSFTFFAPTDASLFALDMTQTASSYTDTLRYHIVPRRLSFSELRLLPDVYMLPTLLSTRRLRVTRRSHSSVITVGGVDVAFHGLFYGRHVAVHGLAGILSLRSNNPPPPTPPSAPLHPPTLSVDRQRFSPRNSPVMPENQTDRGYIPKTVMFNITGWRGSRPPVAVPSPSQATYSVQTPENGRSDAPEPKPDWTVHPPVNLNNAPSITLSPSVPESAISMPPEGYSEKASPAPAPAPYSVQAPVNGRSDVPELKPYWTVHPPANLNNAPSITPSSSVPESVISMPPEGYSDTMAPSPVPSPATVGLELLVRKKNRIPLMETDGETEMPEKSEPLDGVRHCEMVTVGLRDHVSDGDNRYMQCNAA